MLVKCRNGIKLCAHLKFAFYVSFWARNIYTMIKYSRTLCKSNDISKQTLLCYVLGSECYWHVFQICNTYICPVELLLIKLVV